jgi:hypothetical protein
MRTGPIAIAKGWPANGEKLPRDHISIGISEPENASSLKPNFPPLLKMRLPDGGLFRNLLPCLKLVSEKSQRGSRCSGCHAQEARD